MTETKKSSGLSFALLFSLFWLAGSVLAYEFLLMRVLALMVWTPFVHLIISLAMLGFGVSGSILWLSRDYISRQGVRFIFITYLLFLLSAGICYHLSQSINFNAFMIMWDSGQYWLFLLMVFMFFMPFLFGAIGLGAYFLLEKGNQGRIYFFNLIGSGIGIIGIAIAMFFISPPDLGFVIVLLSLIGLLCLALCRESGAGKPVMVITTVIIAIITTGIFLRTDLNISEYKGFSTTVQMPDSKVIVEKYSPLGWLQVVDSPSFHYMPGLSLTYPEFPPDQHALFLDGELLGAIDIIEHHSESNYLKATPTQLPYDFLKNPDVFIVGAVGGMEVNLALMNDARQVDVVDVDSNIKTIVDYKLGEYSNKPYSHQSVNFITGNARTYFKRASEKYDLIIFPAAGSAASTVAGMSALNENYIFTIESVGKALDMLNPDGLLYLSAWVQYPPKEGIKLLALAVESLRNAGFENPEDCVLAFRSWNTISIIIAPSGFTDDTLNEAIDFFKNNSFDSVYFRGIVEDDANRFNYQEGAPYYTAATMLMNGQADELYDRHLFFVQPPTDNQPFFANFLKWESLPELFSTMELDWLPFMDWGQLLTVIAFVHAIIFGSIMIFVPLLLAKTKGSGDRKSSKLSLIIYFSGIGIGFFLLEIGFIQRFSMVLLHPLYSSMSIVALFLLGAGGGSIAYNNLRHKLFQSAWNFFIPVLGFIILYALLLQPILQWSLQFSPVANFVFGAILILPLAFFMGMAFPYGLERISEVSNETIPWAWGINAYTSVLAGIVSPLIAQSGGFMLMMLLAGLCYLAAAMISKRLA